MSIANPDHPISATTAVLSFVFAVALMIVTLTTTSAVAETPSGHPAATSNEVDGLPSGAPLSAADRVLDDQTEADGVPAQGSDVTACTDVQRAEAGGRVISQCSDLMTSRRWL